MPITIVDISSTVIINGISYPRIGNATILNAGLILKTSGVKASNSIATITLAGNILTTPDLWFQNYTLPSVLGFSGVTGNPSITYAEYNIGPIDFTNGAGIKPAPVNTIVLSTNLLASPDYWFQKTYQLSNIKFNGSKPVSPFTISYFSSSVTTTIQQLTIKYWS